MGASLVFVAAEKRDGWWKPATYLLGKPTAFPFLLDEDRAVTKAYGLYHAWGTDAIRIARPATLIVDRAGVIRYLYTGANQIDRAPLDQVLTALRAL